MSPRTRVHRHAGGFMDGHQVRILVKRDEWNLLRLCMQRRWFGGLHVDGLAAAQRVRWPRIGAVHAHESTLDPILNAGAAVTGETRVQPVIETLARIRGFNLKDHAIARSRQSSRLPAKLRSPVSQFLRRLQELAGQKTAAVTSDRERGGLCRSSVH